MPFIPSNTNSLSAEDQVSYIAVSNFSFRYYIRGFVFLNVIGSWLATLSSLYRGSTMTFDNMFTSGVRTIKFNTASN